MASQEGCVTVYWEIRNFSLLLKAYNGQDLPSPYWVVEDTEGRVVRRMMRAHGGAGSFQISFSEWIFSAYRTEMFFISSNGDVLLNVDASRTWFNFPHSVPLFDKNRQPILLNDTMTLCCKTWGKTLKTSECHITTVLHSLNHLLIFEKLASSNFHDTYFEQENFEFHASLKRNKRGNCMVIVEGEPQAPGDLYISHCTLSNKNSFGSVVTHKMIYFNDSERYFSFDINTNTTCITLQLELIVALLGRHELSASSQVVRETLLKTNSPTKTAKHKIVSGALGDDFLLLYRDRALSDATLNTEGKSFSAHRAVLAARSPVFRAMFEKDETSEGRSGVVDIDDVDSETVDRMLVYLYADSVGDLAWKEASALYYAADKYEILPLKEKCADFLKDCLAADNACDVLVLADRHSDQELMTRVVDFILGHEEVMSSAQWMELEEGYPRLCAKITRELFLKRGRKKMRV